jgi:Domain of unknown function (DUF3524)
MAATGRAVLVVEPYFGGSHKRFVEVLVERLFAGKIEGAEREPVGFPNGAVLSSGAGEREGNLDLDGEAGQSRVWVVSLPARKWKWRLSCSSGVLAELVPRRRFDTILVSSMTNLPELLGLRPDLQSAKKLVYFHENQFIYPAQQQVDLQLPWIQCMSALAAGVLCFPAPSPDQCVF